MGKTVVCEDTDNGEDTDKGKKTPTTGKKKIGAILPIKYESPYYL
jgi:hypothetical protein